MTNLALIDGDILVWLASYEKQYMHEVIDSIDYKLKEILENTNSFHYRFFVGGKNNFRYHIRKDYKANRKDTEKPALFDVTKQYFIETLNAFVSNGVETDDTIVATAKYVKDKGLYNPIVCSTDKDYKIKAGTIYSWERQMMGKIFPSSLTETSQEEADYNLLHMLLIGDRGDNIVTCKGVGKAKADKILAGKSRYGMIRAVCDTYKQFYKDKWLVKLTEVFHLINLIDDYNRVAIPKEFNFSL